MFLKTDFTSELVVGQNLGKSKKKSNFLKKGWKPKNPKYPGFGVEIWDFFTNGLIDAKQTLSTNKSSK